MYQESLHLHVTHCTLYLKDKKNKGIETKTESQNYQISWVTERLKKCHMYRNSL